MAYSEMYIDELKHPGCRDLDQTVYVNGTWTTQKVDPLKLDLITVTKLKVCTYNIWFGNERQKLRMKHILEIVKHNEIDIFCFQEVTQSLLKYILSSPFIQKYYLSGITDNDIGAYGNVIFSKYPLIKVYINHYRNTGMGRKLVCADVIINNELFRFGTVHLESMASANKKRIIQLNNSIKFMLEKQTPLQRPQHLMIMGDFNECGTLNKKALPMSDKQFIDAWVEHFSVDGKYEKSNPGWTMSESEYFPAWRPDRLYYAFNYDYIDLDRLIKDNEINIINVSLTDDKNVDHKIDDVEIKENVDKHEWSLKSIVRIGMEKIPTEKEDNITVLTASDHYGLMAEFVWDTGAESKNTDYYQFAYLYE